MTSPVVEAEGWRAAFRRHERALAAGWLVLLALGVGALLVAPVRVRLLHTMQAAVDRWDDRWSSRLAYGEELYLKGDYAAAAAYLERLDAEFPASTVRHGRDKQREWLLTMLGRSYAELQKNGRAMRTFARLVTFDPLNYRNHYEEAQGAARLLSGWALAPEARDAYARVLELMPYHLPSVRGVIEFSAEKGEQLPVVEAYRTYLDAFFLQRVEVRLGDSSFVALVPVDGYPHDVPVPLGAPAGWQGLLTLRPGGFALTLDSVTLTPAITAGVAGHRAERVVAVRDLQLEGMTAGPRGALIPEGFESTLSLPISTQPGGTEQLRLRITLYKPVDAGLWKTVSTAFNNLLDRAGRDSAEARTVPFPSEEAADSVMLRQPWAREGQEYIVDDRGG